MKKKLGSIIFMVVCLLLLMNSKVFAAQKGTATITIERFVLGGSYIVEPTTVEFTQGDTCKDIFKKVADSKGLKYDISKSTWTGVDYLEGIQGVDCGNHAPKEVTVKSTSYTKTKLKAKTTYRYKVRAYKNVGKSTVHGSYSSVKSVKVKK